MRNAGLDEAQAWIKIARRNINNLRYADDTTLMAESEEELKSLLMKVKEESEKSGLKLNTHKMNIMVSGPITSWQIDGEMKVTDFIFLGSKITASTFSPFICHEAMGPDAMILVFWMLNFKPDFSLSSFTFMKSLFSSSLLSVIRVVSSA